MAILSAVWLHYESLVKIHVYANIWDWEIFQNLKIENVTELVSKLQDCLAYFFGYRLGVFPLKNDPKNLDLSHKMDQARRI